MATRTPPPPSHDVAHLFECPRQPTNLTTRDLWGKPIEVAVFLGLETDG